MGVYVSICLPLSFLRERKWRGEKWWCFCLVSCPLCQGAVTALPAAASQLRHCSGGVWKFVLCSVQVPLPTAEHVFVPLCSFLPCVYNRALLCQCESSSVNFSSGDSEDRGREDPVPGGGVGAGDSLILWWWVTSLHLTTHLLLHQVREGWHFLMQGYNCSSVGPQLDDQGNNEELLPRDLFPWQQLFLGYCGM